MHTIVCLQDGTAISFRHGYKFDVFINVFVHSITHSTGHDSTRLTHSPQLISLNSLTHTHSLLFLFITLFWIKCINLYNDLPF